MSESDTTSDTPNAEQIDYWNDAGGENWVTHDERLDAQLRIFGHAAMEAAGFDAGQRVLDVGCGCGATSLEIAGRVGAQGQVLGVDISKPMLERARARAREAGAANLDFQQLDAQTHAFEAAALDRLFSRFGVMFFSDSVRAFANLRGALRPGGRMAFICWRPIGENPWMQLPVAALAQVIEMPTPDPEAPGPFAFADPARVERILAEAGFEHIAIEPYDAKLAIGGGLALEEAADFFLSLVRVVATESSVAPEQRARAAAAVRDALAPHAGEGGVVLDAATWVVCAERP